MTSKNGSILLPIKAMLHQKNSPLEIFVTGATGYLGSYLCHILVSKGHKLTILKRRGSRIERLLSLRPCLRLHDIENGLEQIFESYTPDVVIHAATCYGRLGETPYALYETNIEMPMRLLRASGLRTLFVNTDTSLPSNINLYSYSKHQFSVWASELAGAGLAKVLNIRLESVYGPGDDQTKFATDLVRALLRNTGVYPMTPGKQARDFIYVEDAASAYITLVEHAFHSIGADWQEAGVGTGIPTRIRDFAEMAKILCNAETQLDFGAKPYRVSEVMKTCADVRMLRSLGWKPTYDLRKGIERMIRLERHSL